MPKVMVFGSDGLPLRRLTQWDADRELTIKGLGVPGSPGSVEMHFWDSDTHRALVVPVTNVDGGFKAPIPNILLQRDSPVVFTVYEHTPKGENKATFYHDIPVQRAQKPEDYVWTENVDYISFQELLTEAREVLAQLEAGKDQIITISNQALESARNAAAAAEEAKRLVEGLTNEAAGLPSKQNWGTVKMDTAPGINSPSRLQTYFFALRKSPNRAYQFEIAKDKNQNIVTACGGVPDGLDPDAPAFIIVTLPYSEAGGFVEHIEYRMRKSGDVRCKDYSTTHDTESASWYDSGWYDPEGKGVFFAEYEVTSFQDILVAFKAGKNIWLRLRGRRFMPLLEADDAVDPQIFTFLLSYGMFRARVDVGLQNGETHWKSADIETSASDISAKVPIPGAKQNIQAYLDYLNKKLVTIDVEVRGENSFWTDPLTTGKQIIDMINAGKEVRLHFFDTVTNTGDQLYAYETTVDGVPYFRRNVVSPDEVSRINIGVQYNGEIKFTNVPYTPPVQTAYAVCHDEAEPASTIGNTWYVPKTLPRPSGNVGMMLAVMWEHGQVNSLGYDVRLVWGAPGEPDNVEIVGKASATDSLTGSHSIPAEGTVRYQLEESNGRKRWRYVSGPLIPTQFSTATAAAVADKTVPGLALGYLPGMEIYVQMDAGNTASVMRLIPDEGPTLPVYGNGSGAATGEIPEGYILHLKNAGDHWQIVNQPGGSGGDDEVSVQPSTEPVPPSAELVVFTDEEPDPLTMEDVTGLKEALAGKQPKGDYAEKSDIPNVPAWAMQVQKPSYTAKEVGALPESTKIPTKPSDIGAQPAGNYALKSELSTAGQRAAWTETSEALDGMTKVLETKSANLLPPASAPGVWTVSPGSPPIYKPTTGYLTTPAAVSITSIPVTDNFRRPFVTVSRALAGRTLITIHCLDASGNFISSVKGGSVIPWHPYIPRDTETVLVEFNTTEGIAVKDLCISAENKYSEYFPESKRTYIKKENIDPDFVAGHLAGGKVVFFGDSLFGMHRDDTGAPAVAGRYTGCVAVNVGFGGCRMSAIPQQPGADAFSMYAIAHAVATKDWSKQDAALPNAPAAYFGAQLQKLKSVDFSKVYACVIHYGTNDWKYPTSLDNTGNPLDTRSTVGALRYSIQELLTAYPNLMIYVSIPCYRDGAADPNSEGKTLADYGQAIAGAAREYNLPVIDSYHGLCINALNSQTFIADGVHHNEAGRVRFGTYLGQCLENGADGCAY